MEVKDILKNRRIEIGLTMKELADKIGVSEGTISRWESGHIHNMKRDKVAALSHVLEIPPEVIMGWETDVDRFAKTANIINAHRKNTLNQKEKALLSTYRELNDVYKKRVENLATPLLEIQ